MIYFDKIAIDLLNYLGLGLQILLFLKKKLRINQIYIQSQKIILFIFGSDTSGEKTFEEFYTADEEIDLNLFKTWVL